MNGAVLQMFNHGTITAMLFLLVGVIYDRAHHRYIVYPKDYKDEALRGEPGFGGLASNLPIFSGFVALAFFAGLGLPALSAFISEAMCFIGGFSTFRTLTIIGTLGILLNATYFLRAFQRMFLGKLNERWSDLPDMSIREIGFMVPLAIIVILLGVYPRPALDIMVATMDHLIDLVNMVTQVAAF
jgi:NADH-quinone oxidoreductase subunit M